MFFNFSGKSVAKIQVSSRTNVFIIFAEDIEIEAEMGNGKQNCCFVGIMIDKKEGGGCWWRVLMVVYGLFLGLMVAEFGGGRWVKMAEMMKVGIGVNGETEKWRNVGLFRSGLFKLKPNHLLKRYFCTDKKIGNSSNATGGENGRISKEVDNVNGSSSMSRHDAYKQLENLDFTTAAKILFTTPPKKKEFGLDFHLVQLFFACMPSLAVFLTAMYARSEMRRMEAKAETKKRAEEEVKAKEMELKAAQEKENPSDPHIREVKERLDKLEEIVKEIAVESKTRSPGSSPVKDGETESKQPVTNEVKKIDGKTVDVTSNTAVNSKKQVNTESSSAPQENQKSS